MNFPDMTNYDIDVISMLWGAAGSLLWLAIIKGIVQVIRLIINFIKWLIKRKDERNDKIKN